MKKIMIMHPCIVTRHGLQQLFMRKLPDAEIIPAHSIYDLLFNDDLSDVDLIVSELYGLNENITTGVKLLSFVQSIRHDRPLLIMTDEPGNQVLDCLEYLPGASCIALSEDINQLIIQIDRVLADNIVISLSLSNKQRMNLSNSDALPFSRSEIQVYTLLQKGFSITQIAKKISRSVKTVSAHKRNMMGKLGIKSEVELYACFNQ
ncbi:MULTISPECIES: helix-turn-helix transcriptional regulator [unclassified Serratia (in: enterobacteria)]|uniref:helix-turn-helix domain-containing protein n=1 Tax=unclassified Serratia (in: enterobacteria) TaxID=2647522 RepID=UPI00068FEF4D|nr:MULTISPECIES: LuxR C-terminal-related transcriptional regulator [unclassified Serratia (in: enterobacteria)]